MDISRIENTEESQGVPCSRDAQRSPTSAETRRGLPHQYGRLRLKKRVQTIRVATLNVGSMTAKGREVADLMARRRINILCVQETRWKGNKAKELGDGYKLIYSGTDERGRNGVGVVLDQDIKEQIVEVERKSSRILRIKLMYGQETINVVSAYAPQTGCSDAEKEEFWLKMDEVQRGIPAEERSIVGGDLNGHVGRDKTGFERVHGGRGMGDRNQEGGSILDFGSAFDLAILNTFFTKKSHRTYRSGGNESQIDFLLYSRSKIREVKTAKLYR